VGQDVVEVVSGEEHEEEKLKFGKLKAEMEKDGLNAEALRLGRRKAES
jgi:hypothetical protein